MECWIVFLRIEKFYLFQRSFVRIDILFCCFDFLLKGGSRIVEQFGKLIPSFGSEGTSAEGAFIISVTIVYLHSFFGECLFLWVVADFRKLYGRSNCFC